MRLANYFGALLIFLIVRHSHPTPNANSNPPERKLLFEASRPDPNAWQQIRSVDLDGDGQPDATLQSRNGSGPLSTYFTSYRLLAFPGTRFLRDAKPLPAGTKLRVSDIFHTIDVVDLGTVGGSLRFPNKSFEEFSGGPWWKKDPSALGVMTTRGDVVKMGYVILKMSTPVEINIQPGRMEQVQPAVIEVKAN